MIYELTTYKSTPEPVETGNKRRDHGFEHTQDFTGPKEGRDIFMQCWVRAMDALLNHEGTNRILFGVQHSGRHLQLYFESAKDFERFQAIKTDLIDARAARIMAAELASKRNAEIAQATARLAPARQKSAVAATVVSAPQVK